MTGAQLLAQLEPLHASAYGWAVFLRPQPAPSRDYSDRIATLITEFDTPSFAQTTFPSDLLPAAFPEL